MKCSDNQRLSVLFFAFFFLYSVIQGICLIFSGDDFIWTSMNSISENFGSGSQNGRYFTNILTFLMANYPVIRCLIYTAVMVLLFYAMTKLLCREKDTGWCACFVVIICILLMPSNMYAMTFNWLSGFTNYVIGTMLCLLYMLYCRPLLVGKKITHSPAAGIYTLLLGFFGALCVENITIYNILFSVFVIILSLKLFKKVHLSVITYPVGAVIGTVLMFLNNNYSSVIAEGQDNVGFRHVQFSLPDIFMKIYMEIIGSFSAPFCAVHIFIALSFFAVYIRRFSGSQEEKPPKYSRLCMGITAVYCAYSIFTRFFTAFIPFTQAYRIKALETAFAFLYIIAIIYMAYILFDRMTFMRITLYIVSAVIVTAPFIVVNPVTSRCFFSDYIFWIMTAGELFMQLVKVTDFSRIRAGRYISACVAGFFVTALCSTGISNKYVDILRIRYLKEQIAQEKRAFELISLPYKDYVNDFAYAFEEDVESVDIDNRSSTVSSYVDAYLDYIGVDPETDTSKITLISIMDYNIAQES